MAHTPRKQRRTMLIGGSAALVSTALMHSPRALANRLPTPSQMPGPFYPVIPPLTKDNDLTQVAGLGGRALGQVADLYGRVLDVAGTPLPGARVEIWQCDANGRYRHPGDRRTVTEDPHFQGFGHSVTDADGRYRFRTIRPAPYPGRTPHIHAAVFVGEGRPFVTQIYVAGEPLNERDGLFMRVPVDLRPLLLAEFLPAQDPVATLAAEFDFVLSPRLVGLFESPISSRDQSHAPDHLA